MTAPPFFPAADLAAQIDQTLAGTFSRFESTCCSIHGVTLALHTDDARARALANDLFRPFPPAPASASPGVRLCLTTAAQWLIPAEAEALPPSSNEVIDVQAAYGLATTFARLGDMNYLELSPMGGAAYDLAAGQGLAYLRQPETYRPWLITHLFLMTLGLELLRGRGLYWVHAAAAADAGRAALIVGQTGAGKTTTCLALIAGGFQFLSEDRTFVRVAGAAPVELLAFPKEIAVTARTVELLPWLRQRMGQPVASRRKTEIDPASLFPEALVERARPGVILFPKVRADLPSEARVVAGATGLQRLLPNSLLASQPAVNARHFDALARLVAQSRCYDLFLGPDVEALPDLVRGLLPS